MVWSLKWRRRKLKESSNNTWWTRSESSGGRQRSPGNFLWRNGWKRVCRFIYWSVRTQRHTRDSQPNSLMPNLVMSSLCNFAQTMSVTCEQRNEWYAAAWSARIQRFWSLLSTKSCQLKQSYHQMSLPSQVWPCVRQRMASPQNYVLIATVMHYIGIQYLKKLHFRISRLNNKCSYLH